MDIIDISWPITPTMTSYKDNKNISFEHTKLFESNAVRESKLHIGSHTGTHIDAPAHFMQDGQTIEKIPLSASVGPCHVIDLTEVTEYITPDDFDGIDIQQGDIIICKTQNSQLLPTQPFDHHFVYLAQSAADFLVEKKIKAIGIDYLGIERNQPKHETHISLMRNGIVIIEGLRLQHVQPGRYFLWCLPLAVQGLEAAPARAVLTKIYS